MDLDYHLGLEGSLIHSWGLGLGLGLFRPLLGRGTLLPGHDESSGPTWMEVWPVQNLDLQL